MVWFGGHPFLEQRTAGRSLHETSNSDQPPFGGIRAGSLAGCLETTHLWPGHLSSALRCARTGDGTPNWDWDPGGCWWLMMRRHQTRWNKFQKRYPCQNAELHAENGPLPLGVSLQVLEVKCLQRRNCLILQVELLILVARHHTCSQLCNPGPPNNWCFTSVIESQGKQRCQENYFVVSIFEFIHIVQTYTYTLYYSNLSLLAFWGLVLYPDFPEVEPSYPGKKSWFLTVTKTTSGHLLHFGFIQ